MPGWIHVGGSSEVIRSDVEVGTLDTPCVDRYPLARIHSIADAEDADDFLQPESKEIGLNAFRFAISQD